MKKILITGGSSGIGYETIKNLLNYDVKITALCRTKNRSDETITKINDELKGVDEIDLKLSLPVVDLSSISSIENYFKDLSIDDEGFDVVVFNAGLQYTGSNTPWWSKDGFELTIAVNHLSNQLMIFKLLPYLNIKNSPRIIVTASEVHNPESPGGKVGKKADLGDLQGLKSGKGFLMLDGSSSFNADKAYKDSKLCNILFSKELYRRLSKKISDLTVIAWAPGLLIPKSNEGFFRYSRQYNEIGQKIFAFIARDLLRITESNVNAGKILSSLILDNKYNLKDFKYLSNNIIGLNKRIFTYGNLSKDSMKLKLSNELWEYSCKLLDIGSEFK